MIRNNKSHASNTCTRQALCWMLALTAPSHFILTPAMQERTVCLPILPVTYQQWEWVSLFFFFLLLGQLRHRSGSVFKITSWNWELSFSEIPVSMNLSENGSSHCWTSQSCPTLLCPHRLCSPPGSSVHGIFLGKNTEVGCSFLLQGIFLTQGSNPHLPHWQARSLPLSHQGGPSSHWKWKSFSRVQLFETPWTIQFMEFSRPECCSE